MIVCFYEIQFALVTQNIIDAQKGEVGRRQRGFVDCLVARLRTIAGGGTAYAV